MLIIDHNNIDMSSGNHINTINIIGLAPVFILYDFIVMSKTPCSLECLSARAHFLRFSLNVLAPVLTSYVFL